MVQDLCYLTGQNIIFQAAERTICAKIWNGLTKLEHHVRWKAGGGRRQVRDAKSKSSDHLRDDQHVVMLMAHKPHYSFLLEKLWSIGTEGRKGNRWVRNYSIPVWGEVKMHSATKEAHYPTNDFPYSKWNSVFSKHSSFIEYRSAIHTSAVLFINSSMLFANSKEDTHRETAN